MPEGVEPALLFQQIQMFSKESKKDEVDVENLAENSLYILL